MIWRPLWRSASACSTPETSLPAIGCAGTNEPTWSRSARCADCTTSALVAPTSMISICGVTRCLMALSVASVAATGTATSTMSAPETAIKADGASTSMTPSRRARAGGAGRVVVAHHALDQAGLFHGQRERAAHEPAAYQSQLFEHGDGSSGGHRVGTQN